MVRLQFFLSSTNPQAHDEKANSQTCTESTHVETTLSNRCLTAWFKSSLVMIVFVDDLANDEFADSLLRTLQLA